MPAIAVRLAGSTVTLLEFYSYRLIGYVDDGYMKGKLSVHKHITQQTVFDVAHSSIALGLALTQLSGDVALVSFCPEGFFFSLVSVCLLVLMLLYGTL
jgi:hypothetical protein